MTLRRAMFVAALLILIANQAFCADCLMGRYEPTQSSYTSEKLKLPLALNWEYVGNKFDGNPASPVVVDGTVYFASGDRVYAVDLATGAEKWKYPSTQGLGGAVKGTPAVSNGNVYFGAVDGNLYCLNADTGSFVWAYQTRGAIRCPPVIKDGIIFVGSDDNSLYAINAKSGDMQWKKPFTARDDIAVGVAVGTGMVVISCMDGNMYGVNSATGNVRWPPFRLPVAPTETSPVVVESIAIMAAGNSMFGLSSRSGQQRWQCTLPAEVAATPAVFGFDVFVPCKDKKIYAYTVNGRQPVMKWVAAADLGVVPTSSPVVAGDMLWVTGSRGVVAGFSLVDGSQKWRYMASPSAVTTPTSPYCDASSSPTVAEGALLVLTDDGVLHCFTAEAPDSAVPGIFSMTPANGTVMSGAPPIKMSAVVYDVGSGVDFSSVTMSLDDQPVDQTVDESALTVKFQTEMGGEVGKTAVTLKDGLHRVKVTAKDYAGNLLVKEWYFIADASMPPPRRIAPPVDPGKKTNAPPTRGTPGFNRPNANPDGGQGGVEMPPPPPPPMPGPIDPPAPGQEGPTTDHHRGHDN